MAKIPNEYKREYINTVCRENFARMMVIAALLIVAEPFIAFLTEMPGNLSFFVSIWIALVNLVFLPILFFFRRNVEGFSKFLIMLVQTLFLTSILAGGVSFTLIEQPSPTASSTYLLAVFTVAAFIIMPPAVSAIMFLTSNISFMVMIPQFLPAQDAIATLNINTWSATVVAWIINQMVSRKEVRSFINEKIIIENNAELEKKNLELNELTMRDSMTNLLNHKNSLRRLKEEVDRAKRINYPLSVAMVDLDNFKLVNDTYGHQSGDEVLVQVAKILSDSCRSTDVIGRYGGEEFIIIMPDTIDRDAALLLERIQKRVEKTSFKDGIHITLSCGVSELNGESVHGILKSSDIMLYEAKKKGKNRVEVQFDKDKKKSAAIN
jgi:diguanylate cyclase (GGDEF)-like protein